jgi:hypothetical protein
MERFVVVTTVGEQRIANTACAALESGGIPVMIEHVHVRGGALHGVAYRVLVPMQYSQTALKVLGGIGVTHQEENLGYETAA